MTLSETAFRTTTASHQTSALSVVVADDSPLFVESLIRHLHGDDRFEVVGVADRGESAVRTCDQHRARVAVVDYHLPGLRGPALLRELQTRCPQTQVVVLAGSVDPDTVHEVVALGARGFLVRQDSAPVILEALTRVGLGETGFSRAAELCLIAAVSGQADASGTVLSPRETEILRLLCEGTTTRNIGARIFLAEATVKTYLGRLYAKLEVNDRAAAVAEGMRRGWIS